MTGRWLRRCCRRPAALAPAAPGAFRGGGHLSIGRARRPADPLPWGHGDRSRDHRPRATGRAHRARARQAPRAHRGLAALLRARAGRHAARRAELLPGRRSAAGVVERGEGSRVWDVDGNEYLDFDNGFGVMCVGHADPAIVAAVAARGPRPHFAAPTEGSIIVARSSSAAGPPPLALHQLRYRVDDGRHPPRARRHRPGRGHQDRGLLPRPPRRRHGRVLPAADQLGERGAAGSVPWRRPPRGWCELTTAVPFNDADSLERLLDEIEGQVAGVILEPAMMNVTIVAPKPGYLERVRELTANTASCSSSTRSRPARPSPPAARSSASASRPTSSAWPRRSPAATPAAPWG